MYHKVKVIRKNYSVRATAKLLGVSPGSVQKYSRMSLRDAGSYVQQLKRSSKLDAVKDFIEDQLQKYPKLTATKLHRKLKSRHPWISIGVRALRNYIQPIKKRYANKKIRNYHPVFAEIPGEQVQVDLGECFVETEISDTKMKVYFVSFVFSNSRMMYVSTQTKPYKTEDFIKAHLEAFQYFGGVAKEYVYDQTKLVVIEERYREVIFNQRFYQFALQYEFLPVVCEGYDPQSKGKVERSIRYIKEDFLYGDTFSDIESLRKECIFWLNEVANVRIHATTGQQPCEMFKAEKSLLNTRHYTQNNANRRQVDKTGLVSFKGSKYSVPVSHQRLEVAVEEVAKKLVIRDIKSGKELATHPISFVKGKNSINHNHYKGYRKSIEEITEDAMSLLLEVEESEKLIAKIKSDNPTMVFRAQLQAIKKLAKKFPSQYWNKVVPKLLSLSKIRATLLERMLLAEEKKHKLLEINAQLSLVQTPESSTIDRSMSVYMKGVKNA